ncbi:MAG: YihY/virulence factor BrkB family protein [Terriglobia bacterium]|nr:YihY/virulence factor BrkB family protein [Terriglobia bacterium]
MAGQINRNMEESRIESTKARLQRSAHVFLLGGIPAKTFFSRLWSATNQDQIIDRAAELAYYFLFGLFPALILMSAMFGVFTHVRGPANLELMLYLARVIPPSAFAIVQSAFTQTTKSSDTGHLAFGALAALWAATYGMSSAQTVLNVIYRARESRPYWKAKAIAAGLTVAIFVLVVSAMLLLVLGDFLAKLLISDLLFNPFVHIVWKAIQLVASLFFMSTVFAITYHWGPDRREHRWRWFSPGAVVGVLGWLAASIGLRLYLHIYNPYATMYGSLGAVIVLLVWFYATGFMLLLGAEINAVIERSTAERVSVQSESSPP